jgi:sugar (pentulose or hexulose) kinase
MEFGARGAALIAGEAVGLVTDLRTTAAQVESGACVMPRPAHHQSYTEQLARYRVLVDQVERILSQLHSEPVSAGLARR